MFGKRDEQDMEMNEEFDEPIAAAPTHPAVERSAQRDPIETAWAMRIVPPSSDPKRIAQMTDTSVLHICAQYLAEGRAQVASYAASASAAVRDLLADARARRFEAVQQAKARRTMLEHYREALKRHAAAQRILGPHVRFSGSVGKSLWILLFLVGDTAGMTLALTYGGESPWIAATMALAVGAAVIVAGKTGEDLRRESFQRSLAFEGDEESERVVHAVFGLEEGSRRLNRKVMYAFLLASSLAGVAITTYRTNEESLGIGIAFGLWSLLVSAGSFAASWYYYDPAQTYIALAGAAAGDAQLAWLDTEIDAIEEYNASIEAAKHIVEEHRQRAESAWSMSLAGAAAAMAANSEVIGIAQSNGHWTMRQEMPTVPWPRMEEYLQIVDRDDVIADEDMHVLFAEDGTNQIVRPIVSPADELSL